MLIWRISLWAIILAVSRGDLAVILVRSTAGDVFLFGWRWSALLNINAQRRVWVYASGTNPKARTARV